MPDYSYEKAAMERGFHALCGVDEAGRGPLAGPVCAAAVMLPTDLCIDGLNDSKKLSEKKREELYDVICREATAYAVAFATVEEIERLNILGATFSAMCRAVEGLCVSPDFVLIDGNRAPKTLTVPCATVVKGDALSCSIAAASVLAKVTRDRLMTEIDRQYPQYLFAKHKGYGTKEHIERIRAYGPCEWHRPSFLKKISG
ncbi:MAG: ribonuclease HII [Clostridia bacterium]|nr:ribonuclease HII [Clostridia bacterium]